MKVAVVGAGFSGLAVATGLRHQGFDVDLFEKADAPRSEGGFIGVYNNGFHALHRLGLWPHDGSLVDPPTTFRRHVAADRLTVVDAWHDNNEVISIDLSDKAYGGGMLTVERPLLFDHMMNSMPGARPVCGKNVTALEQQSNGKVKVFFGDGASSEYDLVVGTDGGKSVVRTSIFPDSPVKFQNCVVVCSYHDFDPKSDDPIDRALAKFSDEHRFLMWAHPYNSVALMPLTETCIAAMWFVNPADVDLDSQHLLTFRDSGHIVKRLAKLCSGTSALADTCLQRIRPAPLAWWPICDVDGLKSLYKGRVAVAGESAHFMSPFGGQGTNQCFEDAVVLSEALKTAFDKAKKDPRTDTLTDREIQDALQAYTDTRLKHVNSVQALHRMRIPKFGWIAHKIFSWMMWLLPRSMLLTPYYTALDHKV